MIYKNRFKNNTANGMGGDIISDTSDVKIIENSFIDNKARTIGGAITILSRKQVVWAQQKRLTAKCNLQMIYDNKFIRNEAQIGGSIFSQDLVKEMRYDSASNKDQINQVIYLSGNKYINGSAKNNSQNIFSYPKQLVLDQNNSLNLTTMNYSTDRSRTSMNIVSSEKKLSLNFRVLDQGGNIIKDNVGQDISKFNLFMEFEENKG